MLMDFIVAALPGIVIGLIIFAVRRRRDLAKAQPPPEPIDSPDTLNEGTPSNGDLPNG